jgi:hypothetical protein
VPIDYPMSSLALVIAFLALLYFTFSRNVRGKAIAQFVAPLATAVAAALIFIPKASDGYALIIAVILSIVGPYLFYRQLVFCRRCGSSGSMFSPLTGKDQTCKECGAPLGKPPNTALERTREK